MKLDALGQTLAQSLNNAELWIRQAEQQLLVAEAIAPNLRAPRGMTQSTDLLRVGYLNTTSLLLALSVENSLKAIKASAGSLNVDARGLTPHSRGGGKNGHELVQLAEEAGFSLSASETELLEKLTQVAVWSGKYHAPIYQSQFEAANLKSPKSLTLPNDLSVAKQIFARAAGQCGIRPAIA